MAKYSSYEKYVNFIKKYKKASNAATGSEFDSNANVDNKNVATMQNELPKKDMIGTNRLQMIEKINAVIKNTIPAWKNGISAAIGTEDVRMGNQTLISELDSVLKQNGERSEHK